MDLVYSTPIFHLNIYLYNSLTSDIDFEFQVGYKVNFKMNWTSETYFV